MLDIKYIYNISRTTLPMDKETLESCIVLGPTFGYVHCSYDDLVHTVDTINIAKELTVTRNANKIFDLATDIESTPEVIFKVEGIRTNSDSFTDTVLSTNELETWTDFSTYSNEFKEDIRRLKELCFKKLLWTYENIHGWFLENNIQLGTSIEYGLASDWEKFKADVALTEDLESFVAACREEDKQKYVTALIRNGKKVLEKHKVEYMLHVTENDNVESEIVLRNPIINRIFVVSSKAPQCKKEFPGLRVTSISQRNFGLIGIMT